MAAPTRNTGVGSACENTGSIGLPACLSRGVVEVESKVASFSPEAMALDTVAWPLVTKTGFCVHVFVHVVPAVFPHDRGESRQAGVVLGRIGGDEAALKPARAPTSARRRKERGWYCRHRRWC